jgi:hypothetical protein
MSRTKKPTKYLRVRLDFVVELAKEVDDLPRVTLGILDGAALSVARHLPDDLRTSSEEIAIMSGAKMGLSLDNRKHKDL